VPVAATSAGPGVVGRASEGYSGRVTSPAVVILEDEPGGDDFMTKRIA
jgi:hypothetical protein